ncbi:hypothetical protein BH23ACT5_BH23ACT5_18970 [soil metagenome]
MLCVLTLAITSMVPAGAGATEDVLVVVDKGDDVLIPIGEVGQRVAPQATDPLGLVVGVDTLRDHSLGNDVLDVWSCGVAESASTLAAQLEAGVGAYFAYHSRGRYRPVFNARGNAGSSSDQCQQHSTSNASAQANGAIHVTPSAGGFASPGLTCGFTPCSGSTFYKDGNLRSGFIGNQGGFLATAAHEMGHMIQWPHSFTGLPADFMGQYDNALDLMSGNYGLTSGGGFGSYPDPYSTAVINFYAAGWIDPVEVYVFSGGGGATLNLATTAGTGHKMAVIQAGSRYFTLAARIPSTYDPIPAHWSGIEVYEVEKCRRSETECLFDDETRPGYRRVKPHPAEPFPYWDPAAYDEPLAHVITPGSSRSVNGVDVAVGTVSGQAMSVSIGPDPQPIPDPPPPSTLPSFTDTSGHVFAGDIEWLADSGITRGCNPPVNDRFCPDAPVTRGAMAAFLVRALDLTEGGATFTDTSGHVFANDISRLAQAGITRGCNPAANTRFCPDAPVTRGAMAAFLARALELSSGNATFIDTSGHVFAGDISRLASAEITRGCNPPANDRFCPDAPVTRGAMAAFMKRALGD